MGNVISMSGTENMEKFKYIKDMKPGESGYATTWAYDEETESLNENAIVSDEKGGTHSLFVKCVALGQYAIRFEKPVYRPISLS